MLISFSSYAQLHNASHRPDNGKNKSGAYKYKLILHKGRLRILLVTEKLATKVKYWHGHRIKDDE